MVLIFASFVLKISYMWTEEIQFCIDMSTSTVFKCTWHVPWVRYSSTYLIHIPDLKEMLPTLAGIYIYMYNCVRLIDISLQGEGKINPDAEWGQWIWWGGLQQGVLYLTSTVILPNPVYRENSTHILFLPPLSQQCTSTYFIQVIPPY